MAKSRQQYVRDKLGQFAETSSAGAAAWNDPHAGESLKERKKVFKEQKAWAKDLSKKDRSAVYDYVYDSDPFNSYLRHGKDPASAPKSLKRIDALFEAVPPLKENVTAYRGTNSYFHERVWSKLAVGSTFHDKGFSSCSFSEKASRERFASPTGVMLEVRFRRGQKAIPIEYVFHNDPDHGDEAELLPPRGRTFRVVEWNPHSGIIEIEE